MKLNPTVVNLNEKVQYALSRDDLRLVLILCADGTQYLKVEEKQ